MTFTLRLTLLVITVLSVIFMSSAQNCSDYSFPNNRAYKSCVDLPVLLAHLHWNYIPSTKTVDVAYRANQTSTGWIAWGINPTGTGMIGSQVIVAFKHPNGIMNAFPTAIKSYSPTLQPETLGFKVSNISATHADNEMTIFAVIGPLKSGTTVNHVWQAGPLSNGSLSVHATSGPNVQSMGTINFLA